LISTLDISDVFVIGIVGDSVATNLIYEAINILTFLI